MAGTPHHPWMKVPILLASLILVGSLIGCAKASPSPPAELIRPVDTPSGRGYDIVEIEPLEGETHEACEMLISAMNASDSYRAANFYPEAQIAGCNGGPSEDNSNIYHFRLNGVCREEICGSVLMGWYAVDKKSGRAWELDINDYSHGLEITPG